MVTAASHRDQNSPSPAANSYLTLTPSLRGGIPGHIRFYLQPGVISREALEWESLKVGPGGSTSQGRHSLTNWGHKVVKSAVQPERSGSPRQQGALPACPALVETQLVGGPQLCPGHPVCRGRSSWRWWPKRKGLVRNSGPQGCHSKRLTECALTSDLDLLTHLRGLHCPRRCTW